MHIRHLMTVRWRGITSCGPTYRATLRSPKNPRQFQSTAHPFQSPDTQIPIGCSQLSGGGRGLSVTPVVRGGSTVLKPLKPLENDFRNSKAPQPVDMCGLKLRVIKPRIKPYSTRIKPHQTV